SFTQLLAQRYGDRLDADAREFIGFATDGATRMQRLINDLLAYSRVGTRGKPLAPTSCDEALDAALANLRVALAGSCAGVTRGSLPVLQADLTQLTQLFQNLIGNAIKFRGAEPPRIDVTATRQDTAWLFAVRDNGIGIDPRYADRIFLVFQR